MSWTRMIILISSLLPSAQVSSQLAEPHGVGGSTLVSLDAQHMALGQALTKVAAQVETQIVIVTQEWADYPVSGVFKHATVDAAIKALMRGLDYSLVTIDKEKIEIAVYGLSSRNQTMESPNPTEIRSAAPKTMSSREDNSNTDSEVVENLDDPTAYWHGEYAESEVDVIPPSETGSSNLKWRDVETDAGHGVIDEDVDRVPPREFDF